MEPTISLVEAKERIAKTILPRVTEESIKAKIASVNYVVHDVLTICIIQMSNGFWVIGKSAPASPGNFNKEVGERYAYDDAFKQIWQLEGYALREKLAVA